MPLSTFEPATALHNRRRLLAGAAAMGVAATALTTLGRSAQAQVLSSAAGTGPTAVKRVVFVVSNEVKTGPAGFPVGYYLTELAHPYWAFQQKGWELTIASPLGGPAVHDAMSDPEGGRFGPPGDFLSIGFKRSPRIAPLLANTVKLSTIEPANFDAIFVIGGLGPMVTFTNNEELQQLFARFYEAGKVSATICHGSVILLKTRLSNGKLLAEGKQWTGFSNSEEDAVDKAYGTKVQPFRIEDLAKTLPNFRYVQGPAYRPFAVRDGLLISGQQGASGAVTAELVIQALEGKA